MANMSKKVVVGSMATCGIVALAVLVDMVLKVPFGQNFTMDILFLIGAGLGIYMGYDAYQDLT